MHDEVRTKYVFQCCIVDSKLSTIANCEWNFVKWENSKLRYALFGCLNMNFEIRMDHTI